MDDHDSSTSLPLAQTGQQPAGVRAPSALAAFFGMSARLRDARRLGYAESDPGFQDFALGLLALKDAHQMGSSRAGRDTALLLHRSACRLLARATLLRRGVMTETASWPEIWAHSAQLPGWPNPTLPADESDARWLRDVVESELGELHLARLPSAERERALIAVSSVAQKLAAPLELDATRVTRVIWARRFRASPLLLFGLILAWQARGLVLRPNLALHRPVVVSDRDPTFGVDPEQVVDGDQLNLGFHTGPGPNQTVTIDLGETKSLRRVEIYNRADCCQDRVSPLSVQLSADGQHYETVARKTRAFQSWTAPLPAGSRGRFVRLVHESREAFHLSEVEVY